MNDLTAIEPANADTIRSRILTIRGVQVMLDRDLAELYGVPTKRLNEQVKRNAERFPPTFMFPLSRNEMNELVANCDRFTRMRHSSVPMTAFTEHGIIMLASVLKSGIAIETSIRITNTFVAMRKAIASIAPILARIETAERRQITDQARNEERFDTIFKAMENAPVPQASGCPTSEARSREAVARGREATSRRRRCSTRGGTTRRIRLQRSSCAVPQKASSSWTATATT